MLSNRSDVVRINTHIYVHGAICFSYVGESDISLKPRTKSLDDIVDLIERVGQHPLT